MARGEWHIWVAYERGLLSDQLLVLSSEYDKTTRITHEPSNLCISKIELHLSACSRKFGKNLALLS